jgi:hypothetical protein
VRTGRPAVNLVGMQFARLSVQSVHPERGTDGGVRWVCLCVCGATNVVLGSDLRSGRVRSCGCLRAEDPNRFKPIHGKSHTSIHQVWTHIHYRCSNQRARRYKDYGGRGIRVCARWSGPDGFVHFLEDMGERPSGLSLERRDNDGDYAPDNCYWATYLQQNHNKRNNHLLTYTDETLPVSVWARRRGLPTSTLHNRLLRGWSVERALDTPRPVRGAAP